MARPIHTNFSGVSNATLEKYVTYARRHEGVVVRPDWCSPTRWRMFAAWKRQQQERRGLSKLSKQRAGEQVWQNQIKMECDKRRKERV